FRIGSSGLVDTGRGVEYREFGTNEDTFPTVRWFALWEGSGHSLHFQLLGHELSAKMLGIINQIKLIDSDTGLILRDRAGSSLTYNRKPEFAKWIPELGLLEAVPLSDEEAARLPTSPGAPVHGGQ